MPQNDNQRIPNASAPPYGHNTAQHSAEHTNVHDAQQNPPTRLRETSQRDPVAHAQVTTRQHAPRASTHCSSGTNHLGLQGNNSEPPPQAALSSLEQLSMQPQLALRNDVPET